MLQIDGSFGEGGGQVLRSSLALSMITGRPFRIEGIRKNRRKPGLGRQHFTAVQAARQICRAELRGGQFGDTELEFVPGRVRAGEYRFVIGTAGSTTLVLQTVLPGLLLADGPSVVRISGGTHNPLAPSFDFLAQALLPLLRRMGFGLELRLLRSGFFPAGGGEIEARITKATIMQPLELLERGATKPPQATVLLSRLDADIGRRERAVLEARMRHLDIAIGIESVDTPGPGNAISLALPAEGATEVVTAIGEKRVRAEQVAERAANAALEFLETGAPVGPHLADQLLLPMAMVGSGSFCTVEPTLHTTTNIGIIEQFMDVRFSVEHTPERPAEHTIRVQS